MKNYLITKGPYAHHMMKSTSSVQVSIDYFCEADGCEKFSLCMKLSPLLTALFANSCIYGGRLSGYKSYRSFIWQNTDPDRCGFIPGFLNKDFSFSTYVEFALNAPLFHIYRDKQSMHPDGMTFADFLSAGYEGYVASKDDWLTHLTCLFPEVRLKEWIEIRSCDRQVGDEAFHVPLLIKSILYDESARRAVGRMLLDLKYNDYVDGLKSAARFGLEGKLGRHSLLDLAKELIRIADSGLRLMAQKGHATKLERRLFDTLSERVIVQGICPADRTIRELQSGKSVMEIVRSSAL